MIRWRHSLIALTVAMAGGITPGHASDNHMDVELRFFGSICVATAPGLSDRDVRAAAKKLVASKIKLGPGSNFISSAGKSCGASFRWNGEKLSAVPEAKAKRMVQDLAKRIGASDVSLEAGQGGKALKYTVKADKYQFTLIFEVKGSERLYSISKHR
ncbi:MAG: hypothetical protein BGP11_10320 [Rhodobacterales bacterium 65-51]|uniref:hypothetical protein n=1 Tax=uncultured Gemmobacter sp. TaxID=1095917 RepID=UPI000965C84B|nr:hypothetical protein [uncultured Gemmobacter sp.]OJY31946.1 MAG: hypothetical protein BGP11_10320 [Rhodobacterales bacterium 65-51]